MENLTELQDVWKIYRMDEFDVPALSGINMTVKPHEFVAITGPSGCGKSTMLNMIGCLDMPTRGKVLLEDKDITEFKSDELAGVRDKKIGFIFQTFNLYPTLTALESGRYLQSGDSNAVVIGNSLDHGTFLNDITLNKPVTIGGKTFKVVGILVSSGGGFGGGGGDNSVYAK